MRSRRTLIDIDLVDLSGALKREERKAKQFMYTHTHTECGAVWKNANDGSDLERAEDTQTECFHYIK